MSEDDIRAGHVGRVPDELGDPLTEAEVDALESGTQVVIIWSGGNGPHGGVVINDGSGPFYVPEGEDVNGRLRHYNPITFVGDQRFHTRVWKAQA